MMKCEVKYLFIIATGSSMSSPLPKTREEGATKPVLNWKIMRRMWNRSKKVQRTQTVIINAPSQSRHFFIFINHWNVKEERVQSDCHHALYYKDFVTFLKEWTLWIKNFLPSSLSITYRKDIWISPPVLHLLQPSSHTLQNSNQTWCNFSFVMYIVNRIFYLYPKRWLWLPVLQPGWREI